MFDKLDDLALDRLFRTARTRNAWTDRPVTERQLRELYDLVKFGPTSGNCCPARFVWVTSAEAKAKLAALAAPANAPKILAAPVTVIVGYDLDFAEQLPRLFPARGKEMQGYFSDPLVAEITAFRNSSLQGAYLIIAARGTSPTRDKDQPEMSECPAWSAFGGPWGGSGPRLRDSGGGFAARERTAGLDSTASRLWKAACNTGKRARNTKDSPIA
jgi:Nitroreductase family